MSITPETEPPRGNGPLRRTASEISRSAEDMTDAARAGTWRAVEAVKSRVDHWRGRARRYAEGTREQFETGRDNALEVVRARPGTSTATMFGAGLVAGALLAVVASRALAGRTGAGVQAVGKALSAQT